jgi:hypothetical protein
MMHDQASTIRQKEDWPVSMAVSLDNRLEQVYPAQLGVISPPFDIVVFRNIKYAQTQTRRP